MNSKNQGLFNTDPWSTSFTILWPPNVKSHKALPLDTNIGCLCHRKAFVWLFALEADVASFLRKIIFICKNDWQTMDSQTHVSKSYFLIMNGISPSSKRKQLTVFVAINKIQPLKSKLEVWKAWTHHKLKTLHHYLKTFWLNQWC